MLDVAVMAEPSWDDLGDLTEQLTEAVETTVSAADLTILLDGLAMAEVSIRLTDDDEVHQLNAQWRGKDKPTNVLSFPQLDAEELVAGVAGGTVELLLGDIVLARETCEREAEEKQISMVAHATHLVVHGTLHLLGYDHIDDDEAGAMEALERDVMARLGHADPYRLDGVTLDGE